MFGLAGLQGRLLGQVQGFDRCGWAAVVALEGDGELTATYVDVGAAGGPALVQAGVDADDLPDRPLGRFAVEAFGEPDAEGGAEVLLQRGVVGLRRRHLRLEQHPPIYRQPAAVEGLHLVRHRHMSMQIRVSGPTVPMGERRRHQAGHVDLPDPLRAGASEQRMLLNEPQRILHRRLMGALNHPRDRRVGDRRQGRHGLHRGEGQVVAGDRLRPRPRVFGDLTGHLPRIHRLAAMLGTKELPRDLGADPGPVRRRHRPIPR